MGSSDGRESVDEARRHEGCRDKRSRFALPSVGDFEDPADPRATHRQAQRSAFENVYAALTPQGMFVNADQHLAESSRYAARFEDYWRDYVNRFEHSQVEMDRLMRRRQLDKEAKLSDQIEWLRDAGFRTVECVYKHALISVMVAEKSSG
jgi:hypothetical protein